MVLIALLISLVLVGIGALAAAKVWSTQLQRERETELLWIGEQYRHAIESYWKSTPSARKVLPSTIDQLVNDNRFATPLHHLRQAYPDPVADYAAFEPIIVNNSLIGVRSSSREAPLKRVNFPKRYRQFEAAHDLSEWQFIFLPPNSNFVLPPGATVQ
jgi:type II secretory pathway pseudopilin PulG